MEERRGGPHHRPAGCDPCACTALRCPSDSSQLSPALPAAAPPFWPDGQHSLDLGSGSGGPGSGQKAAFYSRHAAAAAHTYTLRCRAQRCCRDPHPARRCPWRRCPRSCCCCCRRPVSKAGPRPGAPSTRSFPAGERPRPAGASAGSAGRAPSPGPGRMGFGRWEER